MPTREPQPSNDLMSPSGHTAHEPARGDGYSTRQWKSYPMYVCDTCEFSTLSREKIVDHVENAAENNERLAASK